MTQNNSIDEVEIRKTYYESGALWLEIPYVDGYKHGIEKEYYESGVLACETPHVNGTIQGIARVYYMSGAICYETPHKNGYKYGIAKHYDKDNINIDCLILYKGNRKVSTLCLESYRGSSM